VIFTETMLTGAFILDVEELRDDRGLFARTYCRDEFEAHGLDPELVQGNLSHNNRRGTLRGCTSSSRPPPKPRLSAARGGRSWM